MTKYKLSYTGIINKQVFTLNSTTKLVNKIMSELCQDCIDLKYENYIKLNDYKQLLKTKCGCSIIVEEIN